MSGRAFINKCKQIKPKHCVGLCICPVDHSSPTPYSLSGHQQGGLSTAAAPLCQKPQFEVIEASNDDVT